MTGRLAASRVLPPRRRLPFPNPGWRSQEPLKRLSDSEVLTLALLPATSAKTRPIERGESS